MIGRTLSHYKVLEEISRGGMGIVYKALDLKLNREVALKVLPPELVSDPERKRRFVQEAQAAAALKHPNIAHLYEIDDVDGVDFIVMELIEGETLRELLREGPLAEARAIEIAIGVASALANAHEKGIVHRDLKPGNIMVTRDGHPKIIDFGLAKLVEPRHSGDSGDQTAVREETEMGRILGTVSYMSPEQARGQTVDHRSDIFSFGSVLYEMLTGKVPFPGPSAPERLNAIIHTPAAPLPDKRHSLQSVLDRCLAKNPDERYDSMTDVAEALRSVKGGRQDHPLRGVSKLSAALVGGALVLVLAFVLLYSERDSPGNDVTRLTNPLQVTSFTGVEDYPAWSPDGTTLAYAATTEANLFEGNWDIWVTQVPGEQPLNRTADNEGDDRYPSWSPDGQRIAFWSDRNGGGYYVMPAFAGTPRRIVRDPGIEPSRLEWSPDGSEVAYVVTDGAHGFVDIMSLDSGESRRLPLPDTVTAFDLDWSPNGKLFAYIGSARARNNQVTRLWILRRDDGVAKPLTDGQTEVWSPSWSRDGETLYFVTNRGGTMDLWSQRLDEEEGTVEGPPGQLTTGLEMRYAAFSPDGARVAYSKGRRISNVWRVPILDERQATWSDAEQITFDQAFVEFVDVSPDGQRLIVSSDRAGNPDLWMLPSDGGDMQAITNDPTPDWFAAWSPDGKEIAFYAYRSGNRDIWVMPADGGAARQLTSHPARDSYPAWSPDGKEIAFDSYRGDDEDIWIVPAEGGEPRQLTNFPGGESSPAWSPDGQWIFFVANSNPSQSALTSAQATAPESVTIWRIRPTGEDLERLTNWANWPRIVPDGTAFLFERQQNTWLFSLDSRSERQITDLSGRPGSPSGNGSATDGHFYYFCWLEDLSDLWVMDVVTEDR
jgi:Tol biopolymer transport system component/predicted Ser/Thr protein kinase